MGMRCRWLVFLAGLVLALAGVSLLAAPPAAASQLTVEVRPDKPEYLPGEPVTITVVVRLDGRPVPAHIDLAYIEIDDGFGFARRNYITRDFMQVSPGVFIAQGKAGRPGARRVYVRAYTTIKEDCCCRTVCGTGLAYYSVKQVCRPCCPCYYCCPCYQPCQPCLECRPPDFFLKYFVKRPGPGEVERVSLRIKEHVMEQLLQMAPSVTFREAPPHSVIWSDLPGMGWTNDALAELGLTLDPATGRITGEVSAADIRKSNYFFFIEALNPEGEVIAGIWIEIAFI